MDNGILPKAAMHQLQQTKGLSHVEFASDMQIVELDSFETAFHVRQADEDAVRRRFMTLLVGDERAKVGGTSYVSKARSVYSGETFALKRMLSSNPVPPDADLSAEDSARITQGRVAVFHEEYRNQLMVSHLRGFPRVFGFGVVDNDPVIVMEWINGVSVREFARTYEQAEASVDDPSESTPEQGVAENALRQAKRPSNGQIPTRTIAALGISVLEALQRLSNFDSALAHRDLSPTNIIIRTEIPLEEQERNLDFDVCLVDFGSAAAPEQFNPSFTMVSGIRRKGTPEYAAPEMLADDLPGLENLRKSPAIDVFALCSVLFELYAGHTPWRITERMAEKPGSSPALLKLNNPPDPIKLRCAQDEPFANAISHGLAAEQKARPGVQELLSDLRAFLSKGETTAHPSSLPIETPSTSADPTLPVPTLSEGTHFDMVSPQKGGKRAGENVPPSERKRGVTRRQFVTGAIVAVAALAGGGLVGRTCAARQTNVVGYQLAESLWEGALYPAMKLQSTIWCLFSQEATIELPLETTHEPGQYRNGLIRTRTSNGNDATGMWGYKTAVANRGDGNGSSDPSSLAWAIAPIYADAGDFSKSDGLAAVQDAASGLWGFIDSQGTERIAAAFEAANTFSNGFSAVRMPGEVLWRFADAAGTLGKAAFQNLGLLSEEGIAAARRPDEDRWIFVNTDGEEVVGGSFPRVQRFTEGVAACLLDEDKSLWGYINTAGDTAIEAKFAAAYPFVDDLAPAKDAATGLWGIIDAQGAWAVEPAFLSIGEKTGDLYPAHGSPAIGYGTVEEAYDLESDAWEAFMAKVDVSGNEHVMAYGYITPAGKWAILPYLGDTLIRHPEQ